MARLGYSLLIGTFIGVAFLVLSALTGWPDRAAPSDPESDVMFASGTAHCSGGTYDGISTGNTEGSCRQTEAGPNNETRGYKCHDGKGNSATVNCQANGGLGVCESTGSGSCGKFEPTK